MYEIKIDASRSLIEVTLAGLLSLDETAGYIAELKRQFVLNRLRPGYAIVLDVTACPIQTQAMVEAMRGHMATMPKAGAIAVVVGSSLSRMQVRRLFVQPYARVVATPAEGRAWVLSGVEPVGDSPAPGR